MKWHHSLVGISHLAKFREKRVVTVRNANKAHKSKMPYFAMVMEVEK